jgi:hypothetical protein
LVSVSNTAVSGTATTSRLKISRITRRRTSVLDLP